MTDSPTNEEELIERLRFATEQEEKLFITGASTKLHRLINVSTRTPLHSFKLNRVVDFDPDNLTITTQAGAKFSQLNFLASEKNLRIACLPIRSAGATIGGVVASGIPCPLSFRFGLIRDWVTGIRVVLANGASLCFGGKTVKNVSGYDLRRLFIGSLGTLGFITELTLRLLPVAETRSLLSAKFTSLSELLEVLDSISQSSSQISSLEILSPQPAQTILGEACFVLLVLIEGNERAVRSARERLDRVASFIEAELTILCRVADIGFGMGEGSALCFVPASQFPRLLASADNLRVSFTAGRGMQMLIALGEPSALQELAHLTTTLHGWSIFRRDQVELLTSNFDPSLNARIKHTLDPKNLFPNLPIR